MHNPSDVICGQCGEPYSIQHVSDDFTDEEQEKFYEGNGCPSCDWGDGENATNEYQTERRESLVHGNFDGDPMKYL